MSLDLSLGHRRGPSWSPGLGPRGLGLSFRLVCPGEGSQRRSHHSSGWVRDICGEPCPIIAVSPAASEQPWGEWGGGASSWSHRWVGGRCYTSPPFPVCPLKITEQDFRDFMQWRYQEGEEALRRNEADALLLPPQIQRQVGSQPVKRVLENSTICEGGRSY